MTPEERSELDFLKNQVADLQGWKREKERRQITYPLDVESKDILGRDFLRLTEEVFYEAGAAGNPFIMYLAEVAGKVFELLVPSQSLFSVDPSTDIITTSNWQKFFDGEVVNFLVSTGGSLPTPLTDTGNYIVSASDMRAFKVVSGGVYINITDKGSGKFFVYKPS